MDEQVALCADASAAWHSAWLTALGVPFRRDRDVWQALERPPLIYFGGIALTPSVPAKVLAAMPGNICDPWQKADLAPHGYRIWRREPWFVRPPGPLPDCCPEELDIVRVSTEPEVYEFEAVSVRGFGSEDDAVGPGTYHPPQILDDPSMYMYIGRVGGRAVAAAMGYVTELSVGVFGVTTIASSRRRGYGSALTQRAMLTETGLPSVLAPSEEGEPMYRRLGFERVGGLNIWVRAGPGP